MKAIYKQSLKGVKKEISNRMSKLRDIKRFLTSSNHTVLMRNKKRRMLYEKGMKLVKEIRKLELIRQDLRSLC